MDPCILDSEIVEGTENIVKETMKKKAQVNLIIINRPGGNSFINRSLAGSNPRSRKAILVSCWASEFSDSHFTGNL